MNTAYPTVHFWDNLILLKGGIDGPQLAGWTPGPPAKSGLGCVLYADQMIPVDEGVSLAADVYTPKAKGRHPAILVFSAYNKELQSSGAPTGTNETGSPPVFTNRGYAHVVIARRGVGRSQGRVLSSSTTRMWKTTGRRLRGPRHSPGAMAMWCCSGLRTTALRSQRWP